jgi:hypothetical protein
MAFDKPPEGFNRSAVAEVKKLEPVGNQLTGSVPFAFCGTVYIGVACHVRGQARPVPTPLCVAVGAHWVLLRGLRVNARHADSKTVSGSIVPKAADFVPMDAGPELPTGIAFELNRRSEGIVPENPRSDVLVASIASGAHGGSLFRTFQGPGLARTDVSEVNPQNAAQAGSAAGKLSGSDASDPALGRAFRLTRDAVLAWMNILTGPPLVKLSHR